jgi:hypothetical protein
MAREQVRMLRASLDDLTRLDGLRAFAHGSGKVGVPQVGGLVKGGGQAYGVHDVLDGLLGLLDALRHPAQEEEQPVTEPVVA